MKLKYLFLIFVLFSFPVYAGYFGSEAGLGGIGTLALPRSGALTVEKRLVDGVWWGDTYNLVVATREGTATLPFDAAYGYFEVTPFIHDQNSDTPMDYVLITAQGKGTAATSWYLNIYQIKGHKFVSLYHKMIASYFGPANVWWYEVNYATMQNGTPEILLTLRISSPSENKFVNRNLIPKDRYLKVYWDDTKARFVCASNPEGLNAL